MHEYLQSQTITLRRCEWTCPKPLHGNHLNRGGCWNR